MNPKRAEPYLVALRTLRGQLRDGAFGLEARLAATEIADQLRLSPTPVREALARLAGEGLVEDRRGQGYFVRRPSPGDIADLYRLSLMQLTLALEARDLEGPTNRSAFEEPLDETGPMAAVSGAERLFQTWVSEAGSWVLMQEHARVVARLAPIRRREVFVIPDLETEAAELFALDAPEHRPARLAAVRAFHRRRLRLAGRLAALLDRGSFQAFGGDPA